MGEDCLFFETELIQMTPFLPSSCCVLRQECSVTVKIVEIDLRLNVSRRNYAGYGN